MADTEWGDLYRTHVEAVSALAPGLGEAELATTVPATPQWTVHDVLRHMAGVPADVLAERTDGIPGPEWTQRAVDERRGAGIEELLAELNANTDAVAASLVDNPSPAIVWDIAVHHTDLHEALGKGRPPAAYWQPIVDALRSKVPADVEADDYELFRGLFSRRSRSQMQAWGRGQGRAPAERLDEMCIFGPREDDQPIPA
ncbi:hypothetical protein D9V37_17380 [Nocardioides mangrovicus]|uniref:Mycothiol-dependent maleylpyruvate isomerase metal-binding domain-containing protein n=1 Tax=Nocardioides mangrovicus TaxID=2478913 RepID=A0A3L8NXA2_9ACTN|nr:maleylpyruvate isomerase N-terminal domain-containing protein [Nocardioides mangrovicus]RLV47886.1 hypothetical protein D9V37_17380 [Nocardioides mangrovicus]